MKKRKINFSEYSRAQQYENLKKFREYWSTRNESSEDECDDSDTESNHSNQDAENYDAHLERSRNESDRCIKMCTYI